MATPWLNKGWALGDNIRARGMVMISRSEWGRWRRRESACREGGGPQRGAEGGVQRWASQIFSPHQPSRHRCFCGTLWVTSTAQLILRHSWSLLPPKSQHLRPAKTFCCLHTAWLTLLPCLELTIAAHQLLAKPYSTVVTVAVCPQTLLQLLDRGDQSPKYCINTFHFPLTV